MTDYTMLCETFVRLTSVLQVMPEDVSGWFRTVRIDNGIAVASNRRILSAEPIGGPKGVVHIVADPKLIEQCKTETPYGSKLTITVNEMLGYGVAKTTLGYIQQGNCLYTSTQPNDFDKWRSIVEECRKPATEASGPMFWDTTLIGQLAAASPSGRIVFEDTIDVKRVLLMRDIHDGDWIGIFQPSSKYDHYQAATLPAWFV